MELGQVGAVLGPEGRHAIGIVGVGVLDGEGGHGCSWGSWWDAVDGGSLPLIVPHRGRFGRSPSQIRPWPAPCGRRSLSGVAMSQNIGEAPESSDNVQTVEALRAQLHTHT